MVDNSIYVSICCIGVDEEIEHTVRSCFSNAENPNNIFIGIAFIGKKNFYIEIKEKLKEFKNIRYSYYEFENNIGVGKGRNFAAEMYQDEEYFFQIDAHSRFAQGWDKYLIYTFLKSQKIVNNEKVILTRLPGIYKYVDNTNKDPYPINLTHTDGQIAWHKKTFVLKQYSLIPAWGMAEIEDCSDLIKKHINETGISPISKISAACVFGNQHFAKNLCLNKEFILWEEEIIQSIEFIANGFTLVYPGVQNFIYHLYTQDIFNDKGKRDVFQEIMNDNNLKYDDVFSLIKNNFLNYFEQNPDKVKQFENYNNIDCLSGADSNSTFPASYANVGFCPV